MSIVAAPELPTSSGNVRSLARALTVLEAGGAAAEELVRRIAGRTGRARSVGITGAPGVGKSTLVQALGVALLARGEHVAALAFDPTSPFSGGALLGDRVRMTDFVSRGGFVRSMATRGALGGLSAAAADAIDLLDAAGFSWLLIETVGVGQDEIDVAGEVETVLVVHVAGGGDDIQMAKAGIMEVADVLVVNKSDLPGTDQQIAVLSEMLELRPPGGWQPRLVVTQATTGDGIDELLDAVAAHQAYLEKGNRRAALRRERAARRVAAVLAALVEKRLCRDDDPRYRRAVEDVVAGALDPYAAARLLLGHLTGGGE